MGVVASIMDDDIALGEALEMSECGRRSFPWLTSPIQWLATAFQPSLTIILEWPLNDTQTKGNYRLPRPAERLR